MDPSRAPEELSPNGEEEPQESVDEIMLKAMERVRLTAGARLWDDDFDEGPSVKFDSSPEILALPDSELPKVKIYRSPRPQSARSPGFTFEPTPMRIAAIVLGVAVVVLWLRLLCAPGPAVAIAEDSPHTLAGIRWAMVMTSERIDEFRRSYHRTPVDLGELGPPGPTLIGYERVSDDRYRLSAPSSRGPLLLDSMRPREQFLARSLDILREPVGTRP